MEEIRVINTYDIATIMLGGESGSFGEIYFGNLKQGDGTSIPVAMKRYKNHTPDNPISNDIYKEVLILNHLNKYVKPSGGAGIVKFYGIYYDVHENIYLVQERLDMSLHDAFTSRPQKKRLTKKLVHDLVYIYNEIAKCGIVINDIKLANIMFKGDEIRIIDFGLAEFYGLCPLLPVVNIYNCTEFTKAPDRPDVSGYCSNLATKVFKIDPSNTSQYNTVKLYADEYCKLYKEYGVKNIKSYVSDTWSFACTILNAMYGETEHWFKPNIKYDESTGRVRIFMYINEPYEITQDRVDFHPIRGLGEGAFDMLSKMLIPEMDKRMSFKEALNHPYFSTQQSGGASVLFNKMLTRYLPITSHQERQVEYMEDIHNTYRNQIMTITNKYPISENVIYSMMSYNEIDENIDVLLNSIIHYRTYGMHENDMRLYMKMYSNVFLSPVEKTFQRALPEEYIEQSRDVLIHANVYPFWTHISTLTVKLMSTVSVPDEMLEGLDMIIKPEVLELLTIYISLCETGTYNVWDLTSSIYMYIMTIKIGLESDMYFHLFDITQDIYDSVIRLIPPKQTSTHMQQILSSLI